MHSERRRHPRTPRPFDGNWRGASGGATCRISDVSLSGCFVQTMAAPAVGERTTIAIRRPDGGEELLIPGHVRYVERGIGFGVEFESLPDDLADAIRDLMPASS